MASNLDRFRTDVDRLVKEGALLELSFHRLVRGDQSLKKYYENLGKQPLGDYESLKKQLPNFREMYDGWYSECIALLRQLLPDRLADFRAHYEKPKSRKVITTENYVIQDAIQGVTIEYARYTVSREAAFTRLQQQVFIVAALKKIFESSLFDIKQLVQADVFDNELDAARELLKKGYFRAAGAVAGVVLEGHLKQVCIDHALKLTKARPTLSTVNDALRDAGTIEIAQWRFIQHLGDIRNACDHKNTGEPKPQNVEDLIGGVSKIIKTVS